jgi:hypothetical protein
VTPPPWSALPLHVGAGRGRGSADWARSGRNPSTPRPDPDPQGGRELPGGGSPRRGVRHDAQNRRREAVAAARHGHDDGLLAVANRLANLAYAMHQCVVGQDHIRPDGSYQLVLGHETIGVFNKTAQNLEALRPQRNLAISGSQRAVSDIERISLELKHLGAALRLPLPCPPPASGAGEGHR